MKSQFIYFENLGKIVNVDEIAKIEVDMNDKLIAEFEEKEIENKEDTLIFFLKDRSKFRVKGNLIDVWKQLQILQN